MKTWKIIEIVSFVLVMIGLTISMFIPILGGSNLDAAIGLMCGIAGFVVGDIAMELYLDDFHKNESN